MLATLAALLGLTASLALAQSDSYAPVLTTCPTGAGALLRTSGDLNSQEVDYVTRHRQATADAWTTFLTAHDTGYTLSQLAPNASSWPRFGIAASGGGYRAALYGAGSFTAFDVRNTTSPVSGLLQLASYASGLSGGSWAVGSWAINGFPNPTQLVLGGGGNNGWQLERNLFLPDGVLGLSNNNAFLDQITAQVQSKEDAGFNTSLTDAWGRALSYHFGTNTTEDNFFESSPSAHSANLNWNNFITSSAYQNAEVPLPIVVADSRPEDMTGGMTPYSAAYIPLESVEYEYTEWGSHDAELNAFLNVTYMGTHLVNGQADNTTACVQGFQNFGFVIGTSSSLFNAILTTLNTTLGQTEASLLQGIFDRIGGDVREADNDVANYPNAFEMLQGREEWDRYSSATLDLVDGGLNGENVPLTPLLVPARAVDTIVALDASADTPDSWPNATSLYATRDRIQLLNGTSGFPELPPNFTDFVNAGYNKRPTFFGCNVTDVSNGTYPLIVYIANAQATTNSFLTNTSTFKLDYSETEASSFLDVAHANAAQLGRDDQWPVCLSCALVDRTRQRANIDRSAACSACLNRYCYNPANLEADIAQTTATTGIEPEAARSSAAKLSSPFVALITMAFTALLV